MLKLIRDASAILRIGFILYAQEVMQFHYIFQFSHSKLYEFKISDMYFWKCTCNMEKLSYNGQWKNQLCLYIFRCRLAANQSWMNCSLYKNKGKLDLPKKINGINIHTYSYFWKHICRKGFVNSNNGLKNRLNLFIKKHAFSSFEANLLMQIEIKYGSLSILIHNVNRVSKGSSIKPTFSCSRQHIKSDLKYIRKK